MPSIGSKNLDRSGRRENGPTAARNGYIQGRDGRARMADESRQLIDTFGRVHNNLRISVTDRCNLRCTYCMPEEVTFLDKHELLTFEEIARFVRVAAPLGI